EGIERRDTEEVTARLLEAASLLLDLKGKLALASCALPCTLDTIGRGEQGAIYIGLMPMKAPAAAGAARTDSVEAELEVIMYDALYGRRREVLAAVERARAGAGRGAALIDELLNRVPPS